MGRPAAAGSLIAFACITLLGGCGSSPAAPASIPVQTGVEVLRVNMATVSCPGPEISFGLLGLLYTHVQVRQSGSEWVATSTESAGDVEIRLSSIGASPTGAAHLTGTITGTARHIPELIPSLPAWESFINFGSDRRTVLDAFSFVVPGSTPMTGVDGLGTGTVTVGNSAGPQCSGTKFSFSISP